MKWLSALGAFLIALSVIQVDIGAQVACPCGCDGVTGFDILNPNWPNGLNPAGSPWIADHARDSNPSFGKWLNGVVFEVHHEVTNWEGWTIPGRYREKIASLYSNNYFRISFKVDGAIANCWFFSSPQCKVRVTMTVYRDGPGFDPENPPGTGTLPNNAKDLEVFSRTNLNLLGDPLFTGTAWATNNLGMDLTNAGAHGFTWPSTGWVVAQVTVNNQLCPRRWFWKIKFS